MEQSFEGFFDPRIPRCYIDPPRPVVTKLQRAIWHMAHLMNATTSQLAACLSLNSLLRQARAELFKEEYIYEAAFRHARDSLCMYADLVNELRVGMPTDFKERTRENRKERQAYIALMSAAHHTKHIKEYVEMLEAPPKWMRDTGSGVQSLEVGWPQCQALGYLKGLCVDLERVRDVGVDGSGVGWRSSWIDWNLVLDP